MDISDIQVTVQFKVMCDLCTLWQCFGRATQGTDPQVTVILLAEKKNIHEDILHEEENQEMNELETVERDISTTK